MENEERLSDRQAARIMEPIYRMHKIVQQKDETDARTLLALCVQYITENSLGQCLSDAMVQDIVRKALLYHKNGCYYADYIFNELQVKAANWLTLMAIDRPITLETLGNLADDLTKRLSGCNAYDLTVADFMALVKNWLTDVDDIVCQRFLLNEAVFAKEVAALLVH